MAVANCLTTGITLSCANACCSGGVNKVWIAQRLDIQTGGLVRGAAEEITAFTMEATKVFYATEFLEHLTAFVQAGAQANNNNSVDQTLKMVIPCPNDTIRQRLQEIMNCCCGMVVVIQDMAGVNWVIGGRDDLVYGRVKIRDWEWTTGEALADQYALTLTLGVIAGKAAVTATLDPPV